MLSIKEFIDKYLGTQVSVPWGFKGECVSLVQMYLNEVFGQPLYHSNGEEYARGNGRNVGDTLIRDGVAHEISESELRYGDIVIYKSGAYGHCAIYVGNNKVFEQFNKINSRIALWNISMNMKPNQFIRMNIEPKPDYEIPAKLPLEEMAYRVYQGIYGNEPERSTNLKNLGYTDEEVVEIQNIVNKDYYGIKNDIIYIVQAGDTLWDIAKKYNTTVDKLVKDNNIVNKDLIYPNQKIIIK